MERRRSGQRRPRRATRPRWAVRLLLHAHRAVGRATGRRRRGRDGGGPDSARPGRSRVHLADGGAVPGRRRSPGRPASGPTSPAYSLVDELLVRPPLVVDVDDTVLATAQTHDRRRVSAMPPWSGPTADSDWSPTPASAAGVIARAADPDRVRAKELMDSDPATVVLGSSAAEALILLLGPQRRLPAGDRRGRGAPRRRRRPGLRRVRHHRRGLAARTAAPGGVGRRAAGARRADLGGARRAAPPRPRLGPGDHGLLGDHRHHRPPGDRPGVRAASRPDSGRVHLAVAGQQRPSRGGAELRHRRGRGLRQRRHARGDRPLPGRLRRGHRPPRLARTHRSTHTGRLPRDVPSPGRTTSGEPPHGTGWRRRSGTRGRS